MLGRWTLSRIQRMTLSARACKFPAHPHHRTITNVSAKRASIHQRQPHAIHHHIPRQHRQFFTDAIPTVLIPPTIFTGLLLALWTWKCFWIVLLQDKLLYIAWLPPFARSEKISDYEAQCGPVHWEERQIRSLDGTKLTVCEGRMKSPSGSRSNITRAPPGYGNNNDRPYGHAKTRKRVVLCYFQGNGGSTPLRLPLLSDTLRTVTSANGDDTVEYIIVALSYRGYWTSSGRATHSGIELDAQAFLTWVSRTYAAPDTDLRMILWGHSLGTAIASTALATYLARPGGDCEVPVPGVDDGRMAMAPQITGLVMEAPTSSTKDMLISLYPQKWLPYRYLWPFLWNNWDSSVAMERMARWRDRRRGETTKNREGQDERANCSPPPILLLWAEKDEVIPAHAADQIEADATRLGLELERKNVAGAMHTEALVKEEGKRAIINFVLTST